MKSLNIVNALFATTALGAAMPRPQENPQGLYSLKVDLTGRDIIPRAYEEGVGCDHDADGRPLGFSASAGDVAMRGLIGGEHTIRNNKHEQY